jgi:C-terminal processing protease CtpA/Prc
MPRGQDLGDEPMFKWKRPSVVLMGEGNYSDAHMFPEVYKDLKIGKLVGMPVPGTATAVWWETQIDPSLVFGIPQVGVRNRGGKFLENKQLEPDIKVANTPEKAVTGVDEQLAAAVTELLKQLDGK